MNVNPQFRLMLDPGHGGKEPGASNKHTTEAVINLKIAEACKSYLKSYPEIEVEMTRYQDTYVDLHTRGKISNMFQANAFISIHNNAGGGDGFEVYHYTGSIQGKMLAELVAEEFSIIGQNKRFVGSGLYAGTKPGNYTVLEVTDAPAILGEFGFMDTKDYLQFDEQHELVKIGQAYAKAAIRYFGLEIREEKDTLKQLLYDLEKEIEITSAHLSNVKDIVEKINSRRNA
jgi:N-acetylmuramoyl-L-alanine amidase